MALKTAVFKNAGNEAAKVAGQSHEMDATAGKIAARARSKAAGHGSMPSRIGTEPTRGKRGVMDRLVTMDHPEAAFVEFGHIDKRTGKWVKGQRIMRDTFEDISGM